MQKVGRLIPLSEYKKPLLKLTKEDKSQIAELTKSIKGYQYKIQPLEDQLRTPWLPEGEKAVMRSLIAEFTNEIKLIQQQIRNIKVERYKEQLNVIA